MEIKSDPISPRADDMATSAKMETAVANFILMQGSSLNWGENYYLEQSDFKVEMFLGFIRVGMDVNCDIVMQFGIIETPGRNCVHVKIANQGYTVQMYNIWLTEKYKALMLCKCWLATINLHWIKQYTLLEIQYLLYQSGTDIYVGNTL